MLLTVSQYIAAWLIASALLQYGMTLLLARVFRRPQSAINGPRSWPKVGILLSLRGGDDELPDALQSLVDQDYPDFELHIVIDSRQDPAWQIVSDVIARNGRQNVYVSTLRERPRTCSPHCASLAQAARQAESCEVLALVDGDVVAPQHWLRTLVAGLDAEDVGLVHGNRWYQFDQAGLGSVVRYCWNSAAVIVMYLFGFPWGGSCAMRRADMINAGVIDAWLTTLNQDNPAKVKIREYGKRIKFLPELMILNRDSVSLPVCMEFLKRQMLWSKLYSPARRWIYLLIHGWSVLLIEAAAVALLGYALLTGDPRLAITNALGLGALSLAIVVGIARNEKTIRQALAMRGEHMPTPSWRDLLSLVPKTVATQAAYAVVLYRVTFCQRLRWRGVEYEISGPWETRVVAESVAARKAA